MVQTIKISDELWNYLNDHRSLSCRTFEAVIWRFIREDPEPETKQQDEDNGNFKL